MSSIRLETLIKFTDERGIVKKIPIATTLSSRSKPEERDYAIADAATQNCWDPGAVDTENPQTFSFLAIWADGAVDVAFHCDDNAGVGKVVFTLRVTEDVPLILGADDSYANVGADNAFSGTLDVIDRIYINNTSGATRKVKMIIAE
jgi:hypothetical protein